MKKSNMLLCLGLLVLSAGCIRSLHPIYTEKDLVFEPGLVGRWAEDNSDTWTFSADGTNAYRLVVSNGSGKQGVFRAHLLKIKGALFIDLFPEEPELEANDFYTFHLLPVHTFMYVRQIEPTLQMAFPDPDWLEKYLSDHPDALRHERVDDELVLTASTEELQTFWLGHLEAEGAFGEPSDMQRR